MRTEPLNDNDVRPKELTKCLFLYLLINAGFLNILWWFMFVLGTHITSKEASFFNDVLAPNLSNLFTLFVMTGFLLLLISLMILKSGNLLGKKIAASAAVVCIFSPLFTAIYYLLLFMNGKANGPNLTVIPISFGISYFNYFRGKIVFANSGDA